MRLGDLTIARKILGGMSFLCKVHSNSFLLLFYYFKLGKFNLSLLGSAN